ncbi:MAG: efflux RND transporter permease subunit, partial [Muribaculaceae bacterium]|nr:efflux RND transporter permease subunit [Muribaculaceae bacterium]
MTRDKGILSRLDAISPFSLVLVMIITMVGGLSVIPLLDMEPDPRPRRGKTISISFSWPGASPKVMEQCVTSRIEGIVASVKGVESVSSVSNFGSGQIEVELKPQASVPATKFEIASVIKQIHKKLPEGVSYPYVSGGETPSTGRKDQMEKLLLAYQLSSDMKDEQLKEYAGRQLEPALKALEGVKRVEITGGSERYV